MKSSLLIFMMSFFNQNNEGKYFAGKFFLLLRSIENGKPIPLN
jgi:hypothetical protein